MSTPPIVHHFLVFVTIVVVAICQVVADLTCLECTGVSLPNYCEQTVSCLSNEDCYTERVIGDDSNIFYNSGCLSHEICRLKALTSRTSRSQIHICEECCGVDKCNNHLCNQTTSTPTRQCYVCDDVANPRDCNNKVTCAQDEECFTQEFVTPSLQKRFRLSCESKQRCQLLSVFGRKRASTQLCNECCSGPGCNRHLCPLDSSTAGQHIVIPNLPTPCVDHGSVDCANLAQSGLRPCATINNVSTQYCPRYCGYC
ncbi:uncharacterized protein LOC132546373 [Ylistrum balloti]|uniref:uncharacterized protein LOC132546373 n=1 Tax=Ylistrum balloti TaxID=509963 RepID=UPI002905F273|nr:uncharacterized protein LOC132546373 [Ylistrum balloti]